MLYGHSPSISHLRVFGCLCFANDLVNNDKMAPKGKACMFVGYVVNQKRYKVYDLKIKFVFVSRDVVFYENHFPFKGYAAVEQPLFTDLFRPYFDEQVDASPVEHDRSATDTIDNISFQPEDQNDNTTNVEDVNVRRSVTTRGSPIWQRDYAM